MPDEMTISAERRSGRASLAAGFRLAQPLVTTVARVVLGCVLLYSGYAKLIDLPASVRATRAYQLLPESLVPIVGNGLPMFELILGVLLIGGLLTRAAAGLTLLLMLGFELGITSAWARGLAIDCGCFGGGGNIDPSKTTYVIEILRDLGFILLAAFIVRWPRSQFSLDRAVGLDTQPR
jgi:uncharacterized membrane protein YphA (DoxX/SURF4 family)